MEENKYYTILTFRGSVLQGIFIRELDNYIVFGDVNCPQTLCKNDIKNYKEITNIINLNSIEKRFEEWKTMK